MKLHYFIIVCMIAIGFNATARGQCDCPAHLDPNQNGIEFEIGDAVLLTHMAFGNEPIDTTGTCPCADGDADCSGVVDAIDLFRFVRVICGDEYLERICKPDSDCTIDQCPALPSSLLNGQVLIESKTVPVGEQNVQVGIYLQNSVALGGIVLPLEVRSITPGSFVSGNLLFSRQGRMTAVWGQTNVFPFEYFYPSPSTFGQCSGPSGGTYDSSAFLTPPMTFSSPVGLLWGIIPCGSICLPPGDDGLPGTGTPSLVLSFDVTGVPGSFEIDTCCVAPGTHIGLIDCDGDSVYTPSFTKGVITIATCDCPGQKDPNHNGIAFEIGDFVRMNYLAFAGETSDATPTCVCADGDVDCSGVIDIVDLLRVLAVITGEDDGSRTCTPDPDCTIDQCPSLPQTAAGGAIVIESRTVLGGSTNVEVGIHVANDWPISALTLPLEFRTVDGGFVTSCEVFVPAQSRIPQAGSGAGFDVEFFHPDPAALNSCSGPSSSTFASWDTTQPGQFSSPFGLIWAWIIPETTGCIPPGTDGAPGTGSASLKLLLDVTSYPGSFEIDTCCISPGTHLALVDCGADTVFSPSFTKGVITILPPPCGCECLADPQCDGVHDIVDVTSVINSAFRGGAVLSDTDCQYARQDVDCTSSVDVVDVVRMIKVAFRGGNPAAEFCDGCAVPQ